jgi:type IV pilus assembly protein PilB
MTQSQAKRSKALAVRNDLSPFGNRLVQLGYANREQVEQALIETKKSGRPLTRVLEELTGKELTPELQRQYKKHYLFELKVLYGVDSMDPEVSPLPKSDLKALINDLISIDICRRYQLLPLKQENNSLLIAMVNPEDLEAQDDLNRILRPKNMNFRRMVITTEDYQALIEEYLDAQVKAQEKQDKEKSVDVSKEIENLEELSLEDAPNDSADELDVNDAQGAPIVNLVNKILAKALQEGVSDIHIEPQEEHLQVRFRKDGVLGAAFPNLPKKIAVAVAARFKIMADLDIAERRKPQDGKIRRMFQGRPVDFRLNTLPARYGEKACLRILDNSSTQLGLDMLISHKPTLQLVRNLVARPFGLFLVTGPTGSGKSTSLYSCLAERNSPGINICTAEDPIEYSLPGITQVQVIRGKMDFGAILRAFMRQDPDVILVGETRDAETAKTAIEAALTGHLVLTTLHTNDAAGAIARLDEMGVEPFMVSGALLGVSAQRLMRRVCSECRIPYSPTSEELGHYGLTVANEGQHTFFKANILMPDQLEDAKKKGTLCQKCGGIGYKGRAGVYEVMANSERIQALINEGANTDMIKEAAVEEGMITLLAYSLNLVKEGYTTFEEVDRCTYTDSGVEAELKSKRKTVLICKCCGAGLRQEWLDCPYCLTPRF